MARNRSSHRWCSVGDGVLRNFAKLLGKHLSLFNKVAGLRKKETPKKDTLTRAFSCKFCKIFKNNFFTEQLWTTASWDINSKHYISARVNQKKIKSSRNYYLMWTCSKFWPTKNIFRKLWANESLITVCLQIYQELLSLTTFLRVHSNSKEVSCFSWQNTYPNSKTICHIKLKFFLSTKLLDNLLLAKYLISATAPLTLKQIFWKTNTFFKKMDYLIFSWKYWDWKRNISIQNFPARGQWGLKNGPITKNGCLQ